MTFAISGPMSLAPPAIASRTAARMSLADAKKTPQQVSTLFGTITLGEDPVDGEQVDQHLRRFVVRGGMLQLDFAVLDV